MVIFTESGDAYKDNRMSIISIYLHEFRRSIRMGDIWTYIKWYLCSGKGTIGITATHFLDIPISGMI